MPDILILGTGCPKCEKLYNDADDAASELGLDYTIDKISELQKIMSYGVMVTPALVVDGQIKACGAAPSKEEIKHMLSG